MSHDEPTVYAYGRTAFRQWQAILTGSAAVLVASLFWSNAAAKSVFWMVAIVAFFYISYKVWSDERRNVIALQAAAMRGSELQDKKAALRTLIEAGDSLLTGMAIRANMNDPHVFDGIWDWTKNVKETVSESLGPEYVTLLDQPVQGPFLNIGVSPITQQAGRQVQTRVYHLREFLKELRDPL